MQGKYTFVPSTWESVNLFSIFIANAFWANSTYTNSFQYCSTSCMLQLKSIAVIQTVWQQFTYWSLFILVALGFLFFLLSFAVSDWSLLHSKIPNSPLKSSILVAEKLNKPENRDTGPSKGCLDTGLPKALEGKPLVRVESSLWGIRLAKENRTDVVMRLLSCKLLHSGLITFILKGIMLSHRYCKC